MASWGEIGRDSLLAAQWLLQQGQFRSSVSRAYFGLYALVTEQLQSGGHEPSVADRDNPGHQQMLSMLQHNLLRDEARRAVRSQVRRASRSAHRARIVADYVPGQTIDRALARAVLRDVFFVVRQIGGEVP